MKTVHVWLRDVIERLRGLAASNRLVAAISALLLLAITGTLVLMSLQQPGKTTQLGQTTVQVTPPTSTASPTVTLAPTATRVIVHRPPPPPPVPTKPRSTPTPKPSATAGGPPTPTATPCGPGNYLGGNPTQDQIRQALYTAADKYGLPRNMLLAVAWQESRWHQDVYACDGGVGLMQIQGYLADYFNHNISFGTCGLGDTSYDIHVLQDNAYLGAKVLRYLTCYYWYGAGYGGRPWPPNSKGDGTGYVDGSSAYYYWQAGLSYPDLTKLDGSPHPNGFCATVYAAGPLYSDLPSTTSDYWSCPYTPTTGDTTLLSIVLSAYNAGQGAIYNCSCIPNPGYVSSVEGYIPQFQDGTLPTAS